MPDINFNIFLIIKFNNSRDNLGGFLSIVEAVTAVVSVDQSVSVEPGRVVSENFILCFLVVQSDDFFVAEAAQHFSIVDGRIANFVNSAAVEDSIVHEVSREDE